MSGDAGRKSREYREDRPEGKKKAEGPILHHIRGKAEERGKKREGPPKQCDLKERGALEKAKDGGGLRNLPEVRAPKKEKTNPKERQERELKRILPVLQLEEGEKRYGENSRYKETRLLGLESDTLWFLRQKNEDRGYATPRKREVERWSRRGGSEEQVGLRKISRGESCKSCQGKGKRNCIARKVSISEKGTIRKRGVDGFLGKLCSPLGTGGNYWQGGKVKET